MNNRGVITSNVVIGLSTIYFHYCDNNPGWILPGGEITLSKRLAIVVATNIDRMLRQNGHTTTL